MLVNLRLLLVSVLINFFGFYAAALPYSNFDKHDNFTAYKQKALQFSFQSRPDSAIVYFQKALERSADTDSTAVALIHLAEEYRTSGIKEEALRLLTQLETIINQKEKSDKQLFYKYLHLKGKLYSDTGRYQDAIVLFDSAVRFISDNFENDPPDLIKIINYKGVTAYYLGDQNLAMQAYKQALGVALKNDMQNIDLADIYQILV